MIYEPNEKQRQFHSDHRERLLLAGNRCGSTTAAAAETAFHLTGEYPDWWEGRRWDRPTVGWVGAQVYECLTSHVLPTFEKFANVTGKQWSGSGRVWRLDIKHSAGESFLYPKSYEQDPRKWSSGRPDFIWFDQEPPLPIYQEALARTMASGIVWTVTTPVLGYTDYLRSVIASDCQVTRMSVFDVDHISEEDKERMKAWCPPERLGVAGPTAITE